MLRPENRPRSGVLLSFLLVLLLPVPAGCGTLLEIDLRSASPPRDALVLSFIDVGQGDATLVQTGGESYLIDGGEPDAGPRVVDFLRSRGVEELEGVVASHSHSDHIGGLPDVLEALPVAEVYVSGYTTGTSTENAFLRAVQDEGAELLEARAGLRQEWGGATMTVVSPPSDSDGGLFGEANEDSVVPLLEFGSARVLVTGDAENRAEEYMSTGPHAGPLTVLRVAHHGSSTSTTPLFLDRFRPRVAVVSVGADNSYGHPTPQTLRRLETVGAEVFRTDEHGDVIVTIENDELDVAVTSP